MYVEKRDMRVSGRRTRFCLSVYMTILKACTGARTTQVDLGRALTGPLVEEWDHHYDDAVISDLVKGKKNIGKTEVEAARALDRQCLSGRFRKEVVPLLDPNKRADACVGLRRAIASDDAIRESTEVDLVSGMTKGDIVAAVEIVLSDFLTGLFLYAVTAVDNKGTEDDALSVDESFIATMRGEAETIRFVEEWPDTQPTSVLLWHRGPNRISLQAGDIFSTFEGDARAVVVIPVDTAFSTRLSSGVEEYDPFAVSSETIHGKWLEREFANGESEQTLSARVRDSLGMRGASASVSERFPIGTVAPIDENNVTSCLLAIAELDENGNARTDEESLSLAVDSLARFYDMECMGHPLYVPLMGTGRSRAGLDYQQSFELIFNGLKRNVGRIQGSVTIVALPDAYWKLNARKAIDGHAL